MTKNQKGQTLIEAVVALMTILIIITAIAIVIVNGLYNSQFVKNQNEANKLAQEGIEIVRNIQKNDLLAFRGFLNAAALHCIASGSATLYNQECSDEGINTGTLFNRTITFTPNPQECDSTNASTEELKATVTVKWGSSKCPSSNTLCHSSVLESCMPYELPQSNP